MFTDNYIAFRRMAFFGGSTTYYVTDYTGATKSVNWTYSGNSDFGNAMHVGRSFSNLASKYNGVYFGSGITAPKRSDYCLESPIETGLALTSGSIVIGYNGDGIGEASATFSANNTSDADITISEIGYFGKLANGTASSNECLVLYERTVLDEPITIAPGVTKLITYKITFNHR